MFEYQERGRYFAPVPGGMEEMAAEEVLELGAERVAAVHRGVHFSADKEALYRLNYLARHLTRTWRPS